MRKLTRYALLAFLAIGLTTGGLALAQVGSANDDTTTRADDDRDYGWVGLLGLIGLAGLARRKDHHHDTRTTTSASSVR
ncbi:MAG TPA: WGxxGxxG family protein [Xanthomonadales bacterium]|nr:WGxxGxxG family protein [Xanthomonadales bacterium]